MWQLYAIRDESKMSTSIINKIKNAITFHPKLVTFGIGLAITFVVGAAIGMIEPQQALADGSCTRCMQ